MDAGASKQSQGTRHADEKMESRKGDESTAVTQPAAPMNLLIVDDDAATREVCGEVAAQCGMKITSVATAEEALEVIEALAIDILLTDTNASRKGKCEK